MLLLTSSNHCSFIFLDYGYRTMNNLCSTFYTFPPNFPKLLASASFVVRCYFAFKSGRITQLLIFLLEDKGPRLHNYIYAWRDVHCNIIHKVGRPNVRHTSPRNTN